MESFLPDYRDPVFSIAIILLTALAISMAAYGWNIYRQEKLKKSLFGFIDRFDLAECTLDSENMPFDESMAGPLTMLAKAFEQSGEYTKTINICLYLIRHTNDDELLIYLGRVYLRAGLLHRAEDIFLEIISRHPRRKDLLIQLELLFETMHDYEGAREALAALEAQGEETSALESYLVLREIMDDEKITPDRKGEMLYRLLEDTPSLYRFVIQRLFGLDRELAWSVYRDDEMEKIMDILWYLPYSQLHLDIISRNKRAEALYYARGDLERCEKRSGVFAIDTVCAARRCGFDEADLAFSYLCRECKKSFPISFERCPECMALNSIEVEVSIAKKRDEKGDTLL